MAGTINFALTQQFDMDGNPLSGGLLYFFAASTTTPQSAFQDIALTIPHPNPVVLDASGRVPMFYLADGNIKIRLANKNGVTVIAADNLLVIGPSTGGGGGGGGVDPNTVLATGDIKSRFSVGPLPGFVRCNGETVGNAVSGSTERANADCQVLFEYLWSTAVLGVFSGATPSRGATANGDWLANKRIALPDLRGRTLAGMDDMGTTAASRLTSAATGFGSSAIVLGAVGAAGVAGPGETRAQTLAADNIPLPVHNHGLGTIATLTGGSPHTHAITSTDAGHSHLFKDSDSNVSISNGTGATIIAAAGNRSGTFSTDPAGFASITSAINTADGSHNHNMSGSTANTAAPGAATAINFAIVQPTMVLTFYIKL